MKILFLIPHLNLAASNRYRVYQYLPYLHTQGIETTVRPFVDTVYYYHRLYQHGQWGRKAFYTLRSTFRRLNDLRSVKQHDIIFIQREVLPFGDAWLEKWINLHQKPVIFDFDDAIFLPNVSQANKRLGWLKQPQKTSKIIQSSSHIIAGNNYLAEYALRFNPHVTIIPTPIDTLRYPLRPQPNEAPGHVTIGWVGGHTTIGFLDQLRGVFKILAQRYSIRLMVVGGEFLLPGVLVDSQPWQLENEIADLHSFDIGVMPMPDNPWTRGKCGFKALQYMGVGIPTVASPVGVNPEIITHGVNGFLAKNDEEWIESLSKLIEDQGLRKEIGLAGRQTVEQRFSLEIHAPRLIEVLKTTLSQTAGATI